MTIDSWGQIKTYSLKIVVVDKKTNEPLAGVKMQDLFTKDFAVSDANGLCVFSLKKDFYKFRITLKDYRTVFRDVSLAGDMSLDISLSKIVKMKGSRVKNKKYRYFFKMPEMSKTSIAPKDIYDDSYIPGEIDLMRFIHLLPGVQVGDDASLTYVRGGDADQNIVLYDGATVYNPNHLFGLFSIFNADAVEDFDLYTGHFPARYGGALSSVVDVHSREYNSDDVHGLFSLGLLASKINVNGPINKGSTYYSISARGNYSDPLSKNFLSLQKYSDLSYKFYDFNFSLNHRFSWRSKLYVSLYSGHDYGSGETEYDKYYSDYYRGKSMAFDLTETNDVDWGNSIASLRWNYTLNDDVKMDLSGSFSKYKFSAFFDSFLVNEETKHESSFNFDYSSSIYDWALKSDFDCFPSMIYSFKMGSSLIIHSFEPAVNKMSAVDDIGPLDVQSTTFKSKSTDALEFGAYVSKDITIADIVTMDVGVRYALYDVETSMYRSVQPRASLAIKTSDAFTVKMSYSQMDQYVHMLSNSSMHMPTNLWLPSTDNIKPMESRQFVLGALYKFGDFFLSSESYYKNMDNIIETKDGVTFFGSTSNWEDKVEMGRGWAYGSELMLRKKKGKTTGWISYSFSRSLRKFDNINEGKSFAADFDRRHCISVVVSHEVSKRFDFGVSWVFGTGKPVTASNMRLNIASSPNSPLYGSLATSFDGRNSLRAPAYHRLDIGVNFRKQRGKSERIWNITLYNAYGRSNPFYLFMGSKQDDDGASEPSVKQLSFLFVMPSVSYIWKF